MMVPFQYRQLTAAIFTALLTQGVWATEESSEQHYFQEFPVVLSASRLSQPQSEAPNAMTVIDRKMIEASGFRNIADLFKLVPGMYVSYYKGSQPIVSYHGTTDQYARRMQVMIDGRSVYMPPVSMVNWASLPITLGDIERIEVIRGPAAASHGANSLQGVISIITRDAGYMDGKSVSYTRGNKGINDISAHFGSAGKTFDYRMTLAYGADNGYDSLSEAPPGKVIGQSQVNTLLNNDNDSNQVRLLNYRGDYHPNNIDHFDIQFGINHDVQGVGFNDKNTGTNSNTFHDLISSSGFLQLGWIRALDNSAELSLRYYRIQQNQQETFPYYQGGIFFTGPIVQSINTMRNEVEIQHTLSLFADNRLVYGAAYRSDQISGQGNIPLLPPAYTSSVSTDEYRVFAHDEWRITPRVLLNIGGMYERDGMGNENVSPRVALNFHVQPKHTLRMGASVAYRTPSLVETQYPADRFVQMATSPLHASGALFVAGQATSSPGLMPEKMLSQEIGYLGEFGDGATSLDVRLFRDQLGNGIFYAPIVLNPPLTVSSVFTNGLSAVYQGGEVTVKHAFNESSHLTFNFAHELASSNGAFLSASNPAGYRYLISKDPNNKDILSASIPKNSASLLYAQRLGDHFSFSASYYYQDAIQPFDRGSVDYQPPQRRTDVRFTKSFKLDKGIGGELAFVVQNLFDQGYTEYIANNVFNRRSYLTLTLEW